MIMQTKKIMMKMTNIMNMSERYSSHIIVFFHGRVKNPTTK